MTQNYEPFCAHNHIISFKCKKMKIPKNSDYNNAWRYNRTKSFMKNLAELRDMLSLIPASEAAEHNFDRKK